MARREPNVLIAKSVDVTTSSGIVATISTDIKSMRVTDAKVLNYSSGPARISIWITTVADTSVDSKKASLFFHRIGSLQTLQLDEIIGQFIEGGGAIRADSDTANAFTFTASGTSYPLGYE